MTALPTTVFTTNQDLDPARLREAFGIFPTGVVAVAAEVDGQLLGLAASSFTSVSLDPPLVSVSLAVTSKTWPDLRRAGHLGVTILAEHHNVVCRQLAGPVEHRFDAITHAVTEHGAVTLADGLAQFDCDAASSWTPLVFHRSSFGTLQPLD